MRPTDIGIVGLWGDIALTLTAEGELTLTYDFGDDDGGRSGEEEITIVLAAAPDGKITIFDHTGETEVGKGTLDDDRISLHFTTSRPEKLILGYVGIGAIEVDELELLLMKKENGNFDFELDVPGSYHWGLGELDKTAPPTPSDS